MISQGTISSPCLIYSPALPTLFLFSSLLFSSLPTSLAQTPLLETTTFSENFANQTKATPRTNFHPPC